MAIQWKKYIFTINEIYGETDFANRLSKADMHTYYQQKKPINIEKRLTIHKRVLTLCIDLHKSEEMLRKEMNRTTRYQINRAGKDELNVTLITSPTNKDIDEFVGFFNPFAKEKGIELCRVDRVKALKESGMLVISYVFHKDGRKLASHLYITNGTRAVMLYSCSGRFESSDVPTIEVGRANRYLHWQDILFFKEKEYRYYDFLGLSIDKNDHNQQNINKFKKGFGGEEITEYCSYIPQTWKGKLLILLLKIKWRDQLEIIHRREYLTYKCGV